MATVRVCRVVEAPVERLWPLIAEFADWVRWLPAMEGFVLEGGGAAVVGSVRRLGPAEAPVLRERLAACDARTRALTYAVEGPAPIPVRRYEATVSLIALTDRPATVVDWAGTFDAEEAAEPKVRAICENLYGGFIDALAAHCAAGGGAQPS